VERRGRSAVRILALATFLNGVGSGIGFIALPVTVYDLTGSTVWLSLTFFFTFGIVGVVAPLAGKIADRFDRKRIIVICNVIEGMTWLVLLAGEGVVWFLSFGLLAEILGLPASPAATAAVPNLVEEEDLDWANGTLAVARKGSQVAGFVLGGVIVAASGVRTAFLINAASFLITAAITLMVHGRFQAEDSEEEAEARKGSAFAGFPLVWRHPVLRPLFVVWTILFFTIDVAIVGDLPLAIELGAGEVGYGLMNASWGLGAVIGASFGRMITRRFEPWAVLIGALGAGLGYLTIATAPVLAMVLVGNAVAGGTDAGDEVGGFSIIQRSTADAVRGRVVSAVFTAGFLAQAVGFAFAGFVIEAIGPRWTYALCGFGSLAAAPLLMPMFRALREPEASRD
jgi:MFS family permease